MTVQELINALRSHNPDAIIGVWGTSPRSAHAGVVDCELLPDTHTHGGRPILMIRVPEKLTWRRRCSGLCQH